MQFSFRLAGRWEFQECQTGKHQLVTQPARQADQYGFPLPASHNYRGPQLQQVRAVHFAGFSLTVAT